MAQSVPERQGQNSTQEPIVEYVLADRPPSTQNSDRGIYFTPSELNRQSQPMSRPATTQEAGAGTYELVGSSDSYTIPGNSTDSQRIQNKPTEQKAGWTTAAKLQTTLTFMILIIGASALGITAYALISGKIVFEKHKK